MNTLKAPELVARAAPSFGAALVALLVPKCPLCVAAYLAAFGLSASASHSAAPFVRPLALAIAAVASLALALAVWRNRKRHAMPRCCSVL